MSAVLLVVFDGLRPDMVRPDTMPHLHRFTAAGLRFANARSVFPSETRVCSASIATGCHPRRHGVVANDMPHPLHPGAVLDTSQVGLLTELEQRMGARLLEMPTLAERVAAEGGTCAVFSSGSTGQTFLLNPTASANGQVVLSAHGAVGSSPEGRKLLQRLPPPPEAASERAEWIVDAYRATALPDPPNASILWLCEPDTVAHYGGLGSPAQWAVLKRVDAAFGRLIADWEASPKRDRVQIIVASDHGHATITRIVDVRAALGGLPEFGDATLIPGTVGGIVVPDGHADRIAAIARWLMRQDWCGGVYAPDHGDLPDGVLPRGALLADHRRAAHVLYTLRSDPRPSAVGLAGTTLYDGADLERGAGTHGGLSRAELHTVLVMGGSRIRPGMSDWPTGIVDIAPTMLALLGIGGTETMDGRVLREAIADHAPATDARTSETWEAVTQGYAQRLSRWRMGEHVWLDEGGRAAV